MRKKSRFYYYQPNDKDIKDKQGDCVIRALSKALDKTWLEVFDELVPIAREHMWAMDNNLLVKELLTRYGFEYVPVKVKRGSRRPTVESFTKAHESGTFVLKVAHHVVASVDGLYYDTWDSGDCSMYGYMVKKETD